MDLFAYSGGQEASPPAPYDRRMIRGVIFDLGSTLIRRTGLELERVKCAALASHAAARWGCRDSAALAARLLEVRLAGWQRAEAEQVEVPATASFTEAFAAAGIDAADAVLAEAEAVFFEPELQMSRLYPSASETLAALAGMGLRVGMISNATSHRLVVDIVRRHGIERYLDPIVTSAGHGRTKPHPDIFLHVLRQWRLRPDAAVMIGDNLGADILGANTVGMRSILVDIEPHPDNPKFEASAAPSARVVDLRDIPAVLRRWNGTA
jgi:HAD superfamily hydrolase (TIGR01509 family)